MDRKEIVKLLSDHLGVKPKYLRAPSFEYQIQTEQETFIVDREGKIKNADGIEFELERLLNDTLEEIEKEKALTEKLVFPIDGHTGVTLRNLLNMINSKQRLIKKTLELETDIITAEFVEGINNERIVTIEDFKALALAIGIKKVPGISFDFTKKTITFDFIRRECLTRAFVRLVLKDNELI